MGVWQKILYLSVSGALGSLARYGLAGLVQRWAGASFPWGTLSVNILGSFFFGLVWALSAERALLGAEARLFILTGFLGAFTTFSTFTAETANLLADSEILLASANIFGSVGLGLGFFWLGLALGRLI
jgi:CrcB protein